jgi:hypothetical protein
MTQVKWAFPFAVDGVDHEAVVWAATGPTFTTRVACTVSPGVVMKSTAIEYRRELVVEFRTVPRSIQPLAASPVHCPSATSGRALCDAW